MQIRCGSSLFPEAADRCYLLYSSLFCLGIISAEILIYSMPTLPLSSAVSYLSQLQPTTPISLTPQFGVLQVSINT